MPTVLDAAGIAAPSWSTASAAADRRRLAQADVRRPERARPAQDAVLRDDRQPGAVARRLEGHHRPRRTPAHRRARAASPGSHDFDDDHWALFHLDEDPAEANDVGAAHPDVLRRLVDTWWAEAGRNHVLPLEDGFLAPRGGDRAVAVGIPRPRRARGPGGGPVCETLLPPMGGGFRLVAEIVVPDGRRRRRAWRRSATGTTAGRCTSSTAGRRSRSTCSATRCASPRSEPLAPGRAAHRGRSTSARRRAAVRSRCSSTAPTVARGTVPADLPFRWQIGGTGLLIGRDRGFPVCDDYQPPAPFTGTITRRCSSR